MPQPIIVTRASVAQPEALESAAGAGIWDGWSDEDRGLVEATYAAALQQLDTAREGAVAAAGDEAGDAQVMVAPDERAAALVQSALQELAWRGVVATQDLENGQKEAVLDDNDPGWVRTFYGGLRQWLKLGRFDFLPLPAEPTAIPNDCRLAIVGDWGTGTYGGPHCAATIQADPDGFNLLVHLGDVYYSGTSAEVHSNFLQPWPKEVSRNNQPAISRACNSNHEMYSGGHPYADLTLPTFGQSSSVFALENDHWLLVGLDTAYDEWHLAEDQGAWLERLLARDDNRRVILFSHHQPLSHFSKPKDSFVELIDDVLMTAPGKVKAWYFGHEHIGALFEPHRKWGFLGRCVGHSAFPYFRHEALKGLQQVQPVDIDSGEWLVQIPELQAPAALVVDGPNNFIGEKVSTNARYGPNGFMTVHLRDQDLHEQLLTADGKLLVEMES